MPNTELKKGPFLLTMEEIDGQIIRKSAGVYVLEKGEKDYGFIVSYVGRADKDINSRLHQWVGNKYKRFKFDYFSSPKAAFEKECEIYHDFGESEKLDNEIHPDRPKDADWQCPRCDIFRKFTVVWS